jgi:hypothetical protein
LDPTAFFFFGALLCVSRVVAAVVFDAKKKRRPSPVVTAEQFFRSSQSSQVDPPFPVLGAAKFIKTSSSPPVVAVSSPVVVVKKFISSSQVAAALDGFQIEVAAGHDAAADSIKQACTAARQGLFCVNSCVRPLIFCTLFNVVRRVIILSCGGRGLPDHVSGDNWMMSLQKTMIFYVHSYSDFA